MNKEELEERISALESAYAKRVKPDPEAEARNQQAAEDERNVDDMLVLAGGTDVERRNVWQRHEDRNMTPEQAKQAFQENRRDEEWVSGMLKKGGQNA